MISFQGAFHGRTLGSLATTWSPKYREPYAGVLPPTHFVPLNDIDLVRGLFERAGDIAAVIVEPIQSMAGVVEATPEFLGEVRALCSAFGAALIFDEIQTGVGRTGTFSISEQLGINPIYLLPAALVLVWLMQIFCAHGAVAGQVAFG